MAEPAPSGILGIMISQRQPDGSGESESERSPLVMPEESFCRRLCAYGQSIGMLVFLFYASQAAAAAEGWMRGFRLAEGEWRAGRFPLPDVVYDRALPVSAAQARHAKEALRRLMQRKRYVPLNGSLPGKLDVYDAMRHDPALTRQLPDTRRYEGARQLAELLAHAPKGLFLKPSAGSHGKGALRLLPLADGWQIDGRDRHNRPFSRGFRNGEWAALCGWVGRFASAAPYLVQPCLQLTDDEGRSFDVRALIQKDGRGRWSFTGAAVRRGGQGSVTANLHGGGSAVPAAAALSARFGEAAAGKLLADIRGVSEISAACLEARFGRFAELGLDFGIEPDGRLWLLEANAKPGRQSFDGDVLAAGLAVRRPLDYAKLLAAGKQPAFPSTRIQRRYIQEVHP
ncbi:YheC/YheD family protein [Paenibacillus lycopersici]|uniref:YheC/YheD family protein n=1 Tax=Paenibacillus lycopersici TaxID=2704462 RepID=A0A6C0FSI8_9BACL|nr:YheC/YheD family protein [Paenibacillus lycopersici]QHT60116.1 YheC/YheD family protein [Paenibacillus lycopersici]